MKGERPVHLVLPSTAAKAASGSRAARHGRRPDTDALGAQDAALFEALRQHRLLIARAESVPPFVVAADRTLREIAQARPSTLAELKLVHGIGDAKAGPVRPGFPGGRGAGRRPVAVRRQPYFWAGARLSGRLA